MQIPSALKFILPQLHPTLSEIDASKLTEFMNCPRKYFFKYVLGWKSDVPNNHTHFGTAWHEAMEYLLLHGYDETDAAFDCFLRCYREQFAEATDDDYYPKAPVVVREALKKYVKTWKRDREEIRALHTEIGFRVPINQEHTMCGRIDAIIENGRGMYPFDHKTASRAGKTFEKQFDMSMQTGLYTHAAALKYGFQNILGTKYNGAVFYKSGDVKFIRIPAWRNGEQQKVWRSTAISWCDSLQREFDKLADDSSSNEIMYSFPCKPTACTHFGVCAFHTICNTVSNPLQICHKVPSGFKQEFWSPFNRPTKAEITS